MKELFIQEWERIYYEALDAGLSEEQAEKLADEGAYPAMQDRYADLVDQEYQKHKDAA